MIALLVFLSSAFAAAYRREDGARMHIYIHSRAAEKEERRAHIVHLHIHTHIFSQQRAHTFMHSYIYIYTAGLALL